MVAIPPVCDFDWLAKTSNLIGVDQKKYNLDSVKGRKWYINNVYIVIIAHMFSQY